MNGQYRRHSYWMPGDGEGVGPTLETAFAMLDIIMQRLGMHWKEAGLNRDRYKELTNRTNLNYWRRHYIHQLMKDYLAHGPLIDVLGLLTPLAFDLEDMNASLAYGWLTETFNISSGDVGLFYDAAFTRVPDSRLHEEIRKHVVFRPERNYFGGWHVPSFSDDMVTYAVLVNNTPNVKYGLPFGAECTCPHYVGGLAGTDEVCKHIKSVFGIGGSGITMHRAIWGTRNTITYRKEAAQC